MTIAFSRHAAADYRAWETEDPAMAARLQALIADVMDDPFQGAGKPEALRGVLSGWWSRRIGREHRLVYRVAGRGTAAVLQIAQCRYHP
ncbi:MAG: Txe/YoeB family addiction module toxin [Sphingomonas sp.]|uniref:Txe/YoeB family addiction module toxin n=1 Tax=Sphingomonas sp. TaxID=28214 RepID=UPI0035654344